MTPRLGRSTPRPRGRIRGRTRDCTPPSVALAVAGAIAYGLGIASAAAAPPLVQVPTDEQLQPNAQAASTGGLDGYLNSLGRSNYLLGDMCGLRTLLSQYGISLGVAGDQRGARQRHRRDAARASSMTA